MTSLSLFVVFVSLSIVSGQDVCTFFTPKDCYYNPGCHIVNKICVTDPCWEVSSTEDTLTQCSKGPGCEYHIYINNFIEEEVPMSYPIEYCTTGERYVLDFCHLYHARTDEFVGANCSYVSPMPGCGSTQEITLTDGDVFKFCTRNGLTPYDTHDSCDLFSAENCKYNPACEVVGDVCVPDRCFEELETPEELSRGCILGNQCTDNTLTVNNKKYDFCTNGSRDDEVDLCHSVWGTPSSFDDAECFGLLGGNWCKGKATITVNGTSLVFCTRESSPSPSDGDGSDKKKKINVAAIVVPIVVVVIAIIVGVVIFIVVKRKNLFGYKTVQ